eukprot:5689017-Pleurochrysis_carterae.AAC.2
MQLLDDVRRIFKLRCLPTNAALRALPCALATCTPTVHALSLPTRASWCVASHGCLLLIAGLLFVPAAAQHALGHGVPCGDARGPGGRPGQELGAHGLHFGRLCAGADCRVPRRVGGLRPQIRRSLRKSHCCPLCLTFTGEGTNVNEGVAARGFLEPLGTVQRVGQSIRICEKLSRGKWFSGLLRAPVAGISILVAEPSRQNAVSTRSSTVCTLASSHVPPAAARPPPARRLALPACTQLRARAYASRRRRRTSRRSSPPQSPPRPRSSSTAPG